MPIPASFIPDAPTTSPYVPSSFIPDSDQTGTQVPQTGTLSERDSSYGPGLGPILPSSPDDTSHGPVVGALIGAGKSIANLIPSGINLAGNVINAVAHPIKTITGIASAIKGGAENYGMAVRRNNNPLTPDFMPDSDQQAFNNIAASIKNKYGSLDAFQKTATNDPVGVGADIMSLIEGGAGAADVVGGTTGTEIAADTAKQFAQQGVNATPLVGDGKYAGMVNRGVEAVGGAVANPVIDNVVKPIIGAGVNAASSAGGAALGVGPDTLKTAAGASIEGGPAYQAFKQGLSGNVSQDQLVNEARDAMGEIGSTRQVTYQDMLKNLGTDDTNYDISPIMKETDAQLGNFGVTKNSEGALDFSRSKFALDTSAQRDIQNLYDYVQKYGTKPGDRTALGIDNLKQVLGGYWSPNSDYRALVQGIKSTTRDVLSNAPGYDEHMQSYGDLSDQINDIKQGLSLGDRASVETSFKKLIGTFGQNNEFRQQLVQQLDDASGGQLLPKIAGQQLSSWLPRGLMKTVDTAGGGIALVTHPTMWLPILGTIAATSPKLIGLFIRSTHMPLTMIQSLTGVLGKINPAVLPYMNAAGEASNASDQPTAQ